MIVTYRMQHVFRLMGCLFLAIQSQSLAEEEKSGLPRVVEDFGLMDHQGGFRQLSYHWKDSQVRAIVLFTHGVGCPLVRKRYEQLHQLAESYASKGVAVWMLNASAQDSYQDLQAEASEFELSLPILDDDTQEVARALGINRTAEAILIDTASMEMVFRGPIDDRLSYEAAKPVASQSYLTDALEALLAGREITLAQVDAPGCQIHFPAWEAHQRHPVDYARDIAPLLQEKCVRCHINGGIGPFALSSFDKVQGWSDMIQEVVLTGRMPPWQADPHQGQFTGDLSLSVQEKQDLLHWIDQGALRGEGEHDPLAAIDSASEDWHLGMPDHVVSIPAQSVPAEGIVDYRYLTMAFPFEEDTWITGADVLPGDRQALHHVIAFILPPEGEGRRYRRWLTGYAPGVKASLFPADTGILIRQGERLLLELHYTAYGKAVEDQTQLGLYVSKVARKHRLETGIFIDQSIQIPPHDRAFPWSRSESIKKDIILYSMNPHMHFRGKAMRFELEHPDGSRETLVSVPRYNFNWQHTYVLEKPLRVAAGSQLHLHALWDNSERNPSNPDPSAQVAWGEQSFQEMFFGTYQYVLDRGQPTTSRQLSQR